MALIISIVRHKGGQKFKMGELPQVKLTAIGVKRLMERAMWAQELRNELSQEKRGIPFLQIIPLGNISRHVVS